MVSRWSRHVVVGAVSVLALLLVVVSGASAGGSKTGAVYVALGDSYAAGEGLGGFESGTDVKSGSKQNTCHRSSSDAYASLGRSPTLVLPSVTDRAFWACSGATVTGVLGSGRQYGEPVQLATVGPATKNVSLSVGGNDAYFADIVKACLKTFAKGVSKRLPGVSRTCSQQVTYSKTQLAALKSNLAGRVTGLYKRILDRASPSGVLVVAGYPRVFPDSPGGLTELNGKKFCATNALAASGAFIGIEAEDITKQLNPFINGKDGLNDTIKQAVATIAAQDTYKGRIYYADTYNSSSTVPMNCKATPNTGQTLNGVMLSPGKNGTIAAGWISSATFHPTKAGQTLIGRAVQDAFTQSRSLGQVTQLTAGYAHTCAIQKSTGKAVCWGDNEYGQASVPDSLGLVTQLTAGNDHTCAIQKSTGNAVCWGDNEYGQGSVPDSLGQVTQLTAGYYHTCAIQKSTGNAVCWGRNDYGESSVPDSLGQVTQLTAGYAHTCAIQKSTGKAVCWGYNGSGQASVPDSLGQVTQLTAGDYHTCAIQKSTGNAVCWGDNDYGQTSVPESLGQVTQLTVGYVHTCAIQKSTGKAVCWGYNGSGQLNVPDSLG